MASAWNDSRFGENRIVTAIASTVSRSRQRSETGAAARHTSAALRRNQAERGFSAGSTALLLRERMR